MRALALLMAVALLPMATAHVTITADGPTEPVIPGIDTDIAVTVSANCAIVLAEYDANDRSPLTPYANEAPEFVTQVGSDMPFTFTMCQPPATDVVTQGILTINLGPMAPAGQPLDLTIMARNQHGEAEAGEALLSLTVGQYLALTAPVPAPVAVPGHEMMLPLEFEVASNGASILHLEVDGAASGNDTMDAMAGGANGTMQGMDHGDHADADKPQLHLPTKTDVESPLLDGNTTRNVTIDGHIMAPEGWHHASFTVRAWLTSVDGTLESEPQEFVVELTNAHSHSDLDGAGDAEEAPGLGLVAVLGVVLIALLRRR